MKVFMIVIGSLFAGFCLLCWLIGGSLSGQEQYRLAAGAVQINGAMTQVDPEGRIFRHCVSDGQGGLHIVVTDAWLSVSPAARQENAEALSRCWRTMVGSYAPVSFWDESDRCHGYAESGVFHPQ